MSIVQTVNSVNESRLTFRQATCDDLQALLHLWYQVFKGWDDRHRRVIADWLRARMKHERVVVRMMYDGSELIGAAEHHLFRINIDGAILNASGVGRVAMLADRQGSGLGTRLMTDACQWLRNNRSIHYARLGGLHRFYRRFGFTPLRISSLRIPLSDVQAGEDTISFAEVIRQIQYAGCHPVQPFDPDQNAADVVALLAEHSPAPGCEVRDGEALAANLLDRRYVPDQSHFIVNGCDHKPAAYLSLYDMKTIAEAACRASSEGYDALGVLVHHALTLLHRAGASEAKVVQDCMALVQHVLERQGLAYESVQAASTISGTMGWIPDLSRFLGPLLPVFRRRRDRSLRPDWRGVLRLDLSDSDTSADIVFAQDSVTISNCLSERPDIHLTLSQSQLLNALFGQLPAACSTARSATDFNATVFARQILEPDPSINEYAA